MTKLMKNFKAIYDKFNSFTINVSLDGVSKKDEYIRRGTIFEEKTNIEYESTFEDFTISKFNQIIIYTPDIEYLKDLFANKLGIRLALDKIFNFGEKDIRMMFFRIGGVTLEVIENYDSKSLSYGGVGWNSESISKCHKRLIDSNFDMSEVRKGRKPGTIVSTIRNAPLLIPTIIIGSDD